MSDPFDCQVFHELCMDYRGAHATATHNGPQIAYEKLQAYCRGVASASAESPYASALRDALRRISNEYIGMMREIANAALAKNPNLVGPTSDAAPSGATGGNEASMTLEASGPVGLGPHDVLYAEYSAAYAAWLETKGGKVVRDSYSKDQAMGACYFAGFRDARCAKRDEHLTRRSRCRVCYGVWPLCLVCKDDAQRTVEIPK